MHRFHWSRLGRQPALLPCLLLTTGVAFSPTPGPAGLFLIIAVGLCLISLVFSRRSGAHLLVLLAAGAMGLAGATSQREVTLPPGGQTGGWRTLIGEVEAADQKKADLLVASIDGAEAHVRARLWGASANVGERVAVQARLKPMGGPGNPGEQFGDRAERKGLWFSGGTKRGSMVALSGASAFERWRRRQQRALAERVERLAPSPDSAHLYLALASGGRSSLGDALETDFARSGLAHVLSVSGLHVAALGVFALAVLRRLAVRLPLRRLRRIDPRAIAVPPSLVLVWGYVLFTGGEAPAVRSGVMTTALMIGVLLRRRGATLNALAIAAISLLVADPSAIADLSCRLSVLSALGLILLAPALRAALPIGRPDPESSQWRWRWQKLRETALQSLCASLAVMALTTPLLAQAFQRMGIAGLVSNIVCLPICAVISVLAASGAATFVALPSLATPVLWLGTVSCEVLVWFARLFARVPFAAIEVPPPPLWLTAVWMVGALTFALSSGRARWLGLLVPASIVWLVASPHLSRHSELEVTFLSVGHGDAIVVRTGDEVALIDGGGVPGGADTGERFVLPFLRRQGIDRVSLVALSHPHPDHALGLISTLARVPTDRLWLPAGAGTGPLVRDLVKAAGGASVESIEVGHPPFALGSARLEVLGPPNDRLLLESENDRSMVLKLRHGEVTFLFTGDLEEAGEEKLQPGEVTVMKAPHHGSRTSSTAELLARARPKYVVFCVGRHNRFGFPNAEVVQRYADIGAACYRTDLDGAVTFHSDGHSVRVETFREREQTPLGSAHDQ